MTFVGELVKDSDLLARINNPPEGYVLFQVVSSVGGYSDYYKMIIWKRF